MKSKLILQITFVLLAAGLLWFLSRGQTESITIQVTDQGFVPQSVIIKKGSKVEFINETNRETWPASDLHPTHSIYPEFDPQEPIPAGQSWQFSFRKVGEWKYHDHLKPNRRGAVKVE